MTTAAQLYKDQRFFDRLLSKLRARVDGYVRRVVLGSITASDAEDSARFRGTHFGDTSTDGEYMQSYGFASSPPAGSEGIYFKELGVSICADSRKNRPALNSGEVTVWHKSGSAIIFRDDGSIVMLPKAGEKVDIGAEPGADFVALAALVLQRLDDIRTAIANGVPAANDGGATLQASIVALLDAVAAPAAWPESVAAENVRAT